ncbi:MAG TPA: NADH-quinone oxidoreductase subunit C [Bacillota bacterium]|nr:NADH-quinone oxidoreductase subunit C [Bacillota bacterium]
MEQHLDLHFPLFARGYNMKNEAVYLVLKEDLPEACKYFVHERGGRIFTILGNDERQIHGSFALYYIFSIDSEQQFITLKILIGESDLTFPSITNKIPAANWYEREIFDLLGIMPLNHPSPYPLIFHHERPRGFYPLRKEFSLDVKIPHQQVVEHFTKVEGTGIVQIPVGPIHAGIIEPGHFRFSAVGDTVIHLNARLFYTHRGIEKRSEGMPLNQALLLAERICGVCALSHAASFAHAVENIGQTELPERARFLRTIFLELERLYNHIGDVGNICAGFGFAFGISQGSRLREELLQLNERITGHRYLRGVIRLGGTHVDLSLSQIRDIRNTLHRIESEFRELTEILLSHEIAMNRMQSTGRLSLSQVMDLEVVGPAARASGRNIDIRRDQPYAAYSILSFSVPHYTEGDVLARIRVRIDEAFQSFSLIDQAIDRLPTGKICTPINDLPAYHWAFGWSESPRGENVHWFMTGPNQTIYRYRIRSAAYSNWPAVPLAVQGNIIPDFPLINKSFELCYSCCDR